MPVPAGDTLLASNILAVPAGAGGEGGPRAPLPPNATCAAGNATRGASALAPLAAAMNCSACLEGGGDATDGNGSTSGAGGNSSSSGEPPQWWAPHCFVREWVRAPVPEGLRGRMFAGLAAFPGSPLRPLSPRQLPQT